MNVRNGEIRALTGLRGLAALDVAVCHVGDFIIDKYPALKPFMAFSFFDVDLFFCLSALTLCLVYRPGTNKSLDLRKFLVARFARVYPLATASLLLIGPFISIWSYISTPTGHQQLFDAIRQLLLINHWPVIGTGVEWMGPLWSLSVEVFLYVFIFPVLFFWGKSVGRMSSGKIIFGIAGAMILRLIFMDAVKRGVQEELWVQWAGAIAMFVSGWLMYLLYSFHRERWLSLAQATGLMYFVIIAIVLCRTLGTILDVNALLIMGSYGEVMVFLAPFLVGGLLLDGTMASRLLSSRPVYFLGQISYSLYVWHVLVRDYVDDFYRKTLHIDRDISCVALNLIISLLVASLSYFYFECPARNFIRRWLLGRREEKAITSS